MPGCRQITVYEILYLSGNTSRDDDNVGTLESLGQLSILALFGFEVSLHNTLGIDMTQIGSNSRRIDDIVQRKFINQGAGLQQQ